MACLWFLWGQVQAPLSVAITASTTSLPSLWDMISQIQADSGLGCESRFLDRGEVLGRKCSTWVLDPTLLLICQSFQPLLPDAPSVSGLC